MHKFIQYIKNNRHLLFLLFIPFYMTMFFLLEHHVTDNYWVSYLPLDDKIPFLEGFVIPYYLWYPFLAAPGIYVLLRDVPAFKRYMTFIVCGYSFSLLVCFLFPNGQDLRPTEFARDNIFTRLVALMYSIDTNTNVIPSVHVIGSIAALTVVIDCDALRRKRVIPILAALLCAAICASTVLIKQHSILDVFAGIAVAIPLILIIYRKRIFRRKPKPDDTEAG